MPITVEVTKAQIQAVEWAIERIAGNYGGVRIPERKLFELCRLRNRLKLAEGEKP